MLGPMFRVVILKTWPLPSIESGRHRIRQERMVRRCSRRTMRS